MKLVTNKPTFVFTREELNVLKKFDDYIKEEFNDCYDHFTDILQDMFENDPTRRVYDLSSFETFDIKIIE